jgi:hypothetical protein
MHHSSSNKLPADTSVYKQITRDSGVTGMVGPQIRIGENDSAKGLLDSSVNNIYFSDIKSVINNIGNVDSLVDWDDCECVTIYNANKSQYFILHHANGGHKNDYDIFTVGYADELKSGKKSMKIDTKEFHTENNIKLGISENEFLQIFKGKELILIKKDSKKICSFDNSYETYLAAYIFKNNKLIEFRIGYDNS